MNSKRSLPLFIVAMLLSFSAYGKNEAIFFGGGGESLEKNETIFDEALVRFSPFKENSGWSVTSVFDGGHAISEKEAYDVSGGKNKSMTSQNVKAELDSLKRRLQEGDLKNGDQVLLTFATHGFKKQPGESVHKIATIDGDFDLAELEHIRDLAEAKGVKLAILDYSCHSGASLVLGTDKTCVISSASDGVAYNNSGVEFSKNLKKGQSLESIFLSSRSVRNSGAPQISTEAGLKAFQDTRALSNHMLYDESLNDDLETANSCSYLSTDQFKTLGKHLQGIEKAQRSLPLYSPLTKAMKDYEKSRAEAEFRFSVKQKHNENVCIKKICGSRKAWDYEYRLLLQKDLEGGLSAREKKYFPDLEALMKSPEHEAWKKKEALYLEKSLALKGQAEKVAEAERDVYYNLYKNHSQNSKKPNPCRDFKL